MAFDTRFFCRERRSVAPSVATPPWFPKIVSRFVASEARLHAESRRSRDKSTLHINNFGPISKVEGFISSHSIGAVKIASQKQV